MKNLILLLSFLFFLSCSEEKVDCYRIGGTKEECEANEKCEYHGRGAGIFVNGKIIGGIASLMEKWEYYQDPTLIYQIGVCFEKFYIPGEDTDCCPDSPCCEAQKLDWYCYFLDQSIFISQKFSLENRDKIPPGWVQCAALGLFDSDPIECGNGIIEPGEQCDTDQLGTMASCAEHQAAVHPAFAADADYTAGEITCRVDCTWDFSGCTSAE